ncbi:MAG: phage integrase N-terminal SAM-like domain-containing protein [Cyanobacteria bacterium J06626_4]
MLFHQKRHPVEIGSMELEASLTHLAVVDKGSASTQKQAINAVVFLHR